jgi:hypothetical protein
VLGVRPVTVMLVGDVTVLNIPSKTKKKEGEGEKGG